MSFDKFVNKQNERDELRRLLEGKATDEKAIFNNNFFQLEEVSENKDYHEPVINEENNGIIEEPILAPKSSIAQKAQHYLPNEPSTIHSLKEEISQEMHATIEKIVASMIPYQIQGTGGGGLGVHAVRAEISDYTYNKAHIDSISANDSDSWTSVSAEYYNSDQVNNLLSAKADTSAIGVTNTVRLTSANSPYDLSDINIVVFVNTTDGNVQINLPVGVEGRKIRISNTGSNSNTVSIIPNGLENLFGENVAFTLNRAETIDISYNNLEGWW